MSLYVPWCSSSSYTQNDYIPVPVSQYTNSVHMGSLDKNIKYFQSNHGRVRYF